MLQRIDDYALLGDCHSAALVGRDGSIDWACFPRFDSPAVFCRILDARRGGAFRVGPERPFQSTRHYLEDTNILVTTFTTPAGVLEVTDCMPLRLGLRIGNGAVKQLSAARSFQLPRPGAYDFADFALTYHLGRRSIFMSHFSADVVQ